MSSHLKCTMAHMMSFEKACTIDIYVSWSVSQISNPLRIPTIWIHEIFHRRSIISIGFFVEILFIGTHTLHPQHTSSQSKHMIVHSFQFFDTGFFHPLSKMLIIIISLWSLYLNLHMPASSLACEKHFIYFPLFASQLFSSLGTRNSARKKKKWHYIYCARSKIEI